MSSFIGKKFQDQLKLAVFDNYVQLSYFWRPRWRPHLIYKELNDLDQIVKNSKSKMRVLNIFLAAGAVVAQEEESTTIGLDLSDFERGRNKKKQQVGPSFSLTFKSSELIPNDSK